MPIRNLSNLLQYIKAQTSDSPVDGTICFTFDQGHFPCLQVLLGLKQYGANPLDSCSPHLRNASPL